MKEELQNLENREKTLKIFLQNSINLVYINSHINKQMKEILKQKDPVFGLTALKEILLIHV